MLVWRKGAPSPRVKALAAILAPEVLKDQGAQENQEAGEKTE